MIACCTIAHLVACMSVMAPDDAKVARSRIRVCIGTLTDYAKVWPRANKVLRELKGIAGVLLRDDPCTQLSQAALDPTMGEREATLVGVQTIESISAFEGNFGAEDIFLDDWTQF